MPSQAFLVSIWVSAVGFFLLGVITVGGFVLISRELAKVNAVQAAIFVQMRQSFTDLERKVNDLLGR
jgi:hypothetical protein